MYLLFQEAQMIDAQQKMIDIQQKMDDSWKKFIGQNPEFSKVIVEDILRRVFNSGYLCGCNDALDLAIERTKGHSQ